MKIALVCTHGGHLTQILEILEAFKGHQVFFVTHPSTRDPELQAIARLYTCRPIGKRIYLMVWTCFWALWVFVREHPDVIFSTGAEIALPFFGWGRVLGKKTIFLESWSRVKEPSQTGRLAYHFADEFWVQWPELLKAYGPKASYHGAVV